MKNLRYAVGVACLLVIAGCGKNTGVGGTAGDASPTTLAANAEFAKKLNLMARC